jgi:lactate dehydrogenase-like 2-hydroxyacid dehydrogenase
MIFYLIVSGKNAGLTNEQMKNLQKAGSVVTVSHKGKLADIQKLKEDKEEKILGLDPDSFEWDLDSEALDKIPNVKAIITQSTSFDWVKPKELKKKNIFVCNCPGFSSDSVAEYALCMAIEASRRLAMNIKKGWKVDWNQKPMLLKGKTAGIIGLGRIGTRMAELMDGIGMNVVYWSKKTRDKRFRYVSLNELFQTSDVVMPALIENDKTRKLITKKLIDAMKPTAMIVGINRVKAILDEDYIIKRVTETKLGGYAFEGDSAKELSSYKGNIWALPAMAWYTQDSLKNLLAIWVDNMISIAKGKYQNIVN